MSNASVRIQNIGRKVGDKNISRKLIIPHSWDEKGHPIRETGKDGKFLPDFEIKANGYAKVTKEQYDHLRENFAGEIIDLDNIADLQDATKAPAGNSHIKPEGYLSPAEVDALVKRSVKEALDAYNYIKTNSDDTISNGEKTIDEVTKQNEEAAKSTLDEYTPAAIDAFDRTDLIALIEKEKLSVDVNRLRNPDALKKAVWAAIQEKKQAAA